MVPLEKLVTAPVLSLIGAIAAGITGTTGLSAGLGLTPFWTDIAVSLTLFLLSVYWLALSARAARSTKAPAGFAAHEAKRSGVLSTQAVTSSLVTIALLSASLWFVWLPVSLSSGPQWKLCGSFVGGCSPAFCLMPRDSRSRPLNAECVAPLDVSGYVEITPRDGATYKPAWITIQCEGQSATTKAVSESFFSPTCDARMTLQ